MHQELSEYRYCTVFVIEGTGLDADGLERDLERLGDSLLVVGDSSALKVHVHTDDPGAALSLGTASGTIDGIEIADMHRQTLEREERLATGALDGLPTLETGIVVVAPGEGNRRLFKSLRATRVIEGGQTMNPSTEEIVAAVDATPGDRGDRAAEQLERDSQRRAGGRARQQADAGRADALRPGGPGGDDRLRPRAQCRRQRGRHGACARGRRDGRGYDRVSRRASSTVSRCGRVPGSGWRTARRSPATRASTPSRTRWSSGCSTVAARS